jgi:DNA polymerase zeta
MKLVLTFVDYYMTSPHADMDLKVSMFSTEPLSMIPVIRVFGRTKEGIKACLHIHKVYPYIYIPYEGCLSQGNFDFLLWKAQEKIQQVGEIINGAFGSSHFKVLAILLVKGIDFYGFHAHYQYFLKLYLNDPAMVSKTVELLQKGILSHPIQCYEQHIPYLHQFFIDYNLYGMDYIELDHFQCRWPVPVEFELENLWRDPILRLSNAPLELDTWPEGVYCFIY